MLMKNKRGQFFLIAAAIIIAVLLGLTTIYNSATSSNEEVAFYSLAQEFRYEMNKVVEHGKYYDLTDEQIASNLEQVSDSYSSTYSTTDFLAVYTTGQNMNFVLYTGNLEDVSIFLGDSPLYFSNEGARKFKASALRTGNKITIQLNDAPVISKDIFLGDNENYFFTVLKKEKDGERYLALDE